MNKNKETTYIKCADADDLIETMTRLEKENIRTDFCFDRPGYWLEVLDDKA